MESWSEQFLAEWFSLCPCEATIAGSHQYDKRWGDFSIRGYEALCNFLRRQQTLLPAANSHSQRYATNFLRFQLEALQRQDYLYDLGSLESTFQLFVSTYRLTLPTAKADRYRSFPRALNDYISVIREGLRQGKVVSRRQVKAVLTQCYQYATELPFTPLVTFLKGEYLPHATVHDGVGVERYNRAVTQQIGTTIDLLELYEWGYTEIARIQALLDQIPREETPIATSAEELFGHVRQWQLEAWELCQPYFHFSNPIEPPTLVGGSVGNQTMYLQRTATDPGTIAYPDGYPVDITTAMTTSFHEGFPGHHLQLSYPSIITPFEHDLVNYPIFSEGWGLYSERLMEELGVYDNKPSYHLRGRYLMELLRSYRIVVDIGLHLGLINSLSGKVWDYRQALYCLQESCEMTFTDADREVTRYLSLPGQAICYKLGERLLLAARERWPGDLRSFHDKVLRLGQADIPTLRAIFLS